MSALSPNPLQKICIIRLSAIGDVAQAFVAINALKLSQPQLDLTWIIGKTEHGLLEHISDIDFIVFDKDNALGFYRTIAQELRHKRFDALLLMQYSIRASLLSLLVKAPVRLGYPRQLSRELHSLFINRRIEMPTTDAPTNTHVLDVYYSFAKALGLKDYRDVIPPYYLPKDAEFAKQNLPKDKKILLISPCSSQPFKNWLPERYAEIARAAQQQYDMHAVLVGGNSDTERTHEEQIQQQLRTPCASLIGKTSLRQLAAVVAHSDLVVAPDSAIVHIASALRTPVVGLYAATNANRSGPYNYLNHCVNRYPEALKKYRRKSVNDVRWGKHIRNAHAMEIISTQLVLERISTIAHPK